MNELAQLCEKVGGDIEQVRKGMATDVRIGKHFLYAGAGYGGSCFPKDVQALMSTGKKAGVELEIVTAAENANARQKKHLVTRMESHYKTKDFSGKTFAMWGLAFKPNTDDMREAPALTIAAELVKRGAKIRAFDPVAMEVAAPMLKESCGTNVTLCDSAFSTLEGCDALLLVTEWNEFKQVDFAQMKKLLKSSLIFDGRNIYSPNQMKELGFTYYGIGRN